MVLASATFFQLSGAHAVGDSSTKYNVFVPANTMSGRWSQLVVTNVSAVTATVDIIDDGTDGDTDDSVLGVSLSPGDSYVVRLRDGSVNDDAGGKWDGDYFKVRSSHPVMVMMGTSSSWQHDFVPSVGKSGLGTSFYIYSLPSSGSNADLNVFAYEDNTAVSVTDVTTNIVSTSGKATVNLASQTTVLRSLLNQGEDLNVRKQKLGLDALQAGHSYLVQTTHPVSVMTGHLGSLNDGNQARDGGGFVPSANGSSLGSLFFFGIPHETGLAREKELRIVCPNAASVSLYGATTSSTGWSLINTSMVAAGGHLDFVGASNTAFQNNELYKLTVTPAYLGCNLYEANWMETGSYGTSDSASAVSSDEGQGIGHRFSAYMGPPGYSAAAIPTGLLTNNAAPQDGYASHLWIYATANGTSVTVKDLDRSGALVSATFTLQADQFYDFVVDKTAYQKLTTQGVRPYLRVESSQPVSVVSGNVNDNWLTYFHSVLPPVPLTQVTSSQPTLHCGETAQVTVRCDNSQGSAALGNLAVNVTLPVGVQPVADSFSDTPSTQSTSQVSWTASSLAGGSSRDFTMNVQLNCAAMGCQPSNLGMIRAECQGVSGTDSYGTAGTVNLSLVDSARLQVTSFTAMDDPDYTSAVPAPKVRVSYSVTGDGSGTVALEKLVNTALPSSSATSLRSAAGAQSYTYEDSYALHYEETRFYRLKITESSCVRTVGPIALMTSSGQSGGFAAGLESNGRLASDLAARAIARSTGWSQRRGDGSVGTSRSALITGPDAPQLFNLLPETGPDGSVRIDATPSDLPDLTNAKSVASADYLDSNRNRVGTALIIETEGQYYEHSKILCDRAGGSTLDLVDLQRVQPEGSFLRTELRNERHRTGESAIEFKLVEQADGTFRAYAAWLQDQYPKLMGKERVLNIQIWSKRPGYELALAGDILQSAHAAPPEKASVPRSYFQYGHTLGSHIEALVTSDASENLTLRTTRLLTSGMLISDEQPVRMLQFQKGFAPYLEVTMELLDASRNVIDRMWMSDGAWTPLSDAMWGGKTQVKDARIVACTLPGSPASRSDELALAGCAKLSAQVSEFAGVARHLGGGAAPLDVSAYDSVSFTMQSSHPVRVCLESQGRTGSEQPCAQLAAVSQPTRVTLPMSEFVSGSSCRPLPSTALETISFVSSEPAALELTVDDLRFGPLVGAVSATLPCQKAEDAPSQLASGCSTTGQRPIPAAGMMMLLALLGILSLRRAL